MEDPGRAPSRGPGDRTSRSISSALGGRHTCLEMLKHGRLSHAGKPFWAHIFLFPAGWFYLLTDKISLLLKFRNKVRLSSANYPLHFAVPSSTALQTRRVSAHALEKSHAARQLRRQPRSQARKLVSDDQRRRCRKSTLPE